MDNKTLKYKQVATIAVILMLLLAIPSGLWPYGYYQILRWVVAGVALFIAYVALYLPLPSHVRPIVPSVIDKFNLEKRTWVWIMIIIAILFNPIVPLYFPKKIWVIIDFIVAILFLLSIFKIRSYEEK